MTDCLKARPRLRPLEADPNLLLAWEAYRPSCSSHRLDWVARQDQSSCQDAVLVVVLLVEAVVGRRPGYSMLRLVACRSILERRHRPSAYWVLLHPADLKLVMGCSIDPD